MPLQLKKLKTRTVVKKRRRFIPPPYDMFKNDLQKPTVAQNVLVCQTFRFFKTVLSSWRLVRGGDLVLLRIFSSLLLIQLKIKIVGCSICWCSSFWM